MLLVKASIRPSPIHGLGCFTEEPIRKGQVVWRLDPRLDPLIPYEELCAFPPNIQDFLGMYGYVTLREGRKVIVLCGDHSKHMNHADDPNCLDAFIGGVEVNIAARDIAAGEELTCNYYSFDLDVRGKIG